jgi:hypothetical protein
MSCCGGHRAALRMSYQPSPGAARARASAGVATGVSTGSNLPVKHVTFEFNGAVPIVVTGPATGATYRFSAKGVRLTVHASDAPSLVAVPGLRPVL